MIFAGLSAFPLTPMDERGIDDAAFAGLVTRLAEAGVDSIGALGSTGNYAYLTRQERSRVARLAVEAAAGTPVLVSVGSTRASHVLELAEDAQAAGAAALLLAPVSYQPLRADEVFDLYAEADRRMSVPVCVYDNPASSEGCCPKQRSPSPGPRRRLTRRGRWRRRTALAGSGSSSRRTEACELWPPRPPGSVSRKRSTCRDRYSRSTEPVAMGSTRCSRVSDSIDDRRGTGTAPTNSNERRATLRAVTPSRSGARMQRSVAACLASILEIDAGEVPMPDERHPEPWTIWKQWLALRGLGLVPIDAPASFNWPGPWLAVLQAADGHGGIGAVAFGSPPGVAWKPLDGPESFDAVQAGYVIAPADIALWTSSTAAEPRRAGRVEAIAIAPEAEAPMVCVERAVARSGRGLKGDRYFDQRGTFSNVHGRGYDLTLIEAEVLDTLELPKGDLAPEEARRNLITRGIELNALVGKRFTVGGIECLGQRLCEPCAHLERLTAKAGKPGTLRALIHKGGLRADIVSDGEIEIGDEITAG